MNIKWDAAGYTNNFSYVHEYGNDVIGLLSLNLGQSVLDLGCGNGALTKKLIDIGLSAIGLDASEELLEIAKKNYPDIHFMLGDATNFVLEKQVDAVFSNAVLHWIDQDKQSDMLRCVHSALKPGGQFVFELGGKGNNDLIHQTLHDEFKHRGYVYKMQYYFPSIGAYSSLLEEHGFSVSYAVLFDRATPLNGKNGLSDYIYMFIKTPFEGMTEKEKADMVQEAVTQLKPNLYKDGIWYSDYVRLRMKAQKI